MSKTISDTQANYVTEEIERIRELAYREQPDTLAPLLVLLDLMQTMFCQHEWTTGVSGGDPTEEASAEVVTFCQRCGIEKDQT